MKTESLGNFCGSVLLSEDSWNKNQLLADLKEDWGLELAEEDTEEGADSIISDLSGYRIVISKFPVPVPDNEAEINAQNNFMWEEAVEVTSTHKAHIVVAILGAENTQEDDEKTLIDRGLLYTKIMASCTKQDTAIGVFTSGVVYEPSRYYSFAQAIKEGDLPILNWIWIGLYGSKKGISAYTYGMDVFGKYEMEILDARDDIDMVYGFITMMASYVLEENVELRDGETIGFSKDDIHEITLSKGVALPDQDTLKISYAQKKKSWWSR